ncbi:vacuolar sorting-associated-like protein [Novymonas esmeraldas]|uniref:Vacuolar protein sorting-associated protein 35 n=1 Tax=Novymonas esmeraldas TaxID=1808958 RepID=A0AAW0F3H6_9TRYP
MAIRLPAANDGGDEVVATLRGSVLTAAEEQRKWLQEALIAVESKAAAMHTAIDNREDLSIVIRAAAVMLDELRTNLLEPQNYYELYMKVFSAMEAFAAFLADEHRERRRTLEEMYERVQFCGYIVPRLYLLIAAGAVYINAGEQPALEIARDLVEMCKGVQHPTRGLFLRHFLLTMMKGKLPGDPNRRSSDGGDDTVADGGTVADTAHLLVQNFKEMNWLWIRMEAGSYANRNGGSTHSVTTVNAAAASAAPPVATSASASTSSVAAAAAAGTVAPSRSSDAGAPQTPLGSPQRSLRAARRTQQERRAMCVLVGMNVVRIAQLDGITRDTYASTILPQLLSIMVRYCEPLAQQYLFEILIQVFPDELHLFTIDKLVDAFTRTVAGVDVAELMRTLMERLTRYAAAVQDGVAEVSDHDEAAKLRDLFPMLLHHVSEMPVTHRAHVSTNNIIKRTSSIPAPSPLLLGAYVTVVRHLVPVALTLHGKSAKRRLSALSSVVDVVAAKFSTVSTAPAEAPATGKDEAAAAPVAISPAAALAAGQFLVFLISDCCATVQEVLAMEGVATLAACLPFLERRAVAVAVCDAALRGSTAAPLLPTISKAAPGGGSGVSAVAVAPAPPPPPSPRPITALEDVARLFELLDPLLVEQADTPSDPHIIYRYNPAVEFADEQALVCRVLHLLASADPVIYAKMITGARKLLLLGGAQRMLHTYPTLLALHRRAAMRLHAQYTGAGGGGGDGDVRDEAVASQAMKAVHKCFSYLHSGDSKGILEVFAVEAPVEALTEYLLCSSTADVCEQPETSYELFAEALTLYDSHVEDAREQMHVITTFVNTLYNMRHMAEENYEVLAAKVCQYGSKMVKKSDQSHLIAVCAALFAKKRLSQANQQRVQECLRRSLKLAGQVLALAQLQLYVRLLNIFLHFFTAKGGYLVSVELVNELLEKISEASEAQRPEGAAAAAGDSGGDGDDEDGGAAAAFAEVRLTYRNITKYIRSRQSTEERWGDIEV